MSSCDETKPEKMDGRSPELGAGCGQVDRESPPVSEAADHRGHVTVALQRTVKSTGGTGRHVMRSDGGSVDATVRERQGN